MEMPEAQYRKLIESGTEGPDQDPQAPPETSEDPTFVLEKYLEEFIFTNFDLIFKGTLKIYHEADVSDGRHTLLRLVRLTFWRLIPSQTPSSSLS